MHGLQCFVFVRLNTQQKQTKVNYKLGHTEIPTFPPLSKNFRTNWHTYYRAFVGYFLYYFVVVCPTGEFNTQEVNGINTVYC